MEVEHVCLVCYLGSSTLMPAVDRRRTLAAISNRGAPAEPLHLLRPPPCDLGSISLMRKFFLKREQLEGDQQDPVSGIGLVLTLVSRRETSYTSLCKNLDENAAR